MSTDAVSVVITTYNRNEYLRSAIESALAQTYDPVTVRVVDGSDDRTAAPVCAEYNVTYSHQPDRHEGVQGPAAARDRGVEASDARFVAFLDDDDRLLERAVEKRVDALADSPGTGVAYCGMRMASGHERLPDPDVRGDVLEAALKLQVGSVVPSTLLVERALLESVPPMRTLPHDDAALVIELARRTRFAAVDEALVKRGEPETTLRNSTASLAGRRQTIDRYRDLYDEHDPSVRNTARSRTYFQEGQQLLDRRTWSPAAIRAFALANYYAPSVQLPFAGALVASLFGRPARDAAAKCFVLLRGDRQRGNVGAM